MCIQSSFLGSWSRSVKLVTDRTECTSFHIVFGSNENVFSFSTPLTKRGGVENEKTFGATISPTNYSEEPLFVCSDSWTIHGAPWRQIISKERVFKTSVNFFWVPGFRPETMKEAEPLLGVLSNMGFIPTYRRRRDIDN